jgi:hypothetical protein
MAARPQLDREAVLGRVQDRSAGLVTEISTILLGGVLSAAGFGLIEIFRHPTDWPIRLILWLVGMIACFIVYFRLATRAPFYVTSGSAVFVAMPVVGVCEVLLFAVLTLDGPGAWRYWFIAAAALSMSGVLTNVLELRRLRPHHYAADVEAVFAHLRSRLRSEAWEAVGLTGLAAAMGAGVWALPRDWPYFAHLMGGYLALSALLAAVIVPREARDTESLVEALRAATAARRRK